MNLNMHQEAVHLEIKEYMLKPINASEIIPESDKVEDTWIVSVKKN